MTERRKNRRTEERKAREQRESEAKLKQQLSVRIKLEADPALDHEVKPSTAAKSSPTAVNVSVADQRKRTIVVNSSYSEPLDGPARCKKVRRHRFLQV